MYGRLRLYSLSLFLEDYEHDSGRKNDMLLFAASQAVNSNLVTTGSHWSIEHKVAFMKMI